MTTTTRILGTCSLAALLQASVIDLMAGPPPRQGDHSSELACDDAAFALLLESYQQLQTSQIEGDYQERVFLADQVENHEVRHKVLELARQERDGRLAKLETSLQQMEDGYHQSRRHQEIQLGRRISRVVDAEGTRHRLKQMRLDHVEPYRVTRSGTNPSSPRR